MWTHVDTCIRRSTPNFISVRGSILCGSCEAASLAAVSDRTCLVFRCQLDRDTPEPGSPVPSALLVTGCRHRHGVVLVDNRKRGKDHAPGKTGPERGPERGGTPDWDHVLGLV